MAGPYYLDVLTITLDIFDGKLTVSWQFTNKNNCCSKKYKSIPKLTKKGIIQFYTNNVVLVQVHIFTTVR